MFKGAGGDVRPPAGRASDAWPRAVVIAAGAYALIGGLVTFLGWALDVPRLADWFANGIATQPNTALALMLGGAALVLLVLRRRRGAAALGALVAAIGLLTLLQHLAGADLGIDQPLTFGRAWGSNATMSPGRMGPPASISLTLIGGSLTLLGLGAPAARARRLVPVVSLTVAALMLFSLAGYLFDAHSFYTIPWLSAIALQTTTMLLALAVGLIATVPDHEPMCTLRGGTQAAALARVILPSLVVMPLALGQLRDAGVAQGWYDVGTARALNAIISIVVTVSLTWWALSALRRREERLARQSEELRLVTDAMPALLSYIDTRGRYRFVSKHYEEWFGLDAHELVGRHMREVLGQAAFERIRPRVEAALRGERLHYEDEVPYKFGGTRFIRAEYVPDRGPDGAVEGFYALVTDITERKRAEASLRQSESDARLLQALGAELVLQDDLQAIYGKFVAAAAAVMRSRFASLQILAPVPGGASGEVELHLLAHRGFTPEAARYWARVWPTSESSCAEALRRRARVIVPDVEEVGFSEGSGDLRMYRQVGIRAVQTTTLVTRDGTLVGMVSTHWDHPHEPSERELRNLDILARQAADLIERQKAREQVERDQVALREAKEAAEAANAAKDQFLAVLSHELRTPLSPVMTQIALWERRPDLPAALRPGLQMMRRNVELEARLIDDLLDLNRIARGKLELRFAVTDLHAELRHAVGTVSAEAAVKRIALTVETDAPRVEVMADAARIQQVLWNLLKNAVKFTPPGGAIAVYTSIVGGSVGNGSGTARVEVRDTGAGIGPDLLPRVFNAFEQGGAEVTRRFGGLGLGLAISRAIVELHGGRLTVHSEGVGRGATFTLELALAAHSESTAKEHLPRRTRPDAPIRILLVEDHEDTARTMTHLLEALGHAVRTAGSVREARSIWRAEGPFDLLLSDLGLPDGTGNDLMRALNVAQPVTGIALTGFGMEEDVRRTREAGFAAHLTKPVDLEQLEVTIQRLAGGGVATREV